MTTLTVEIGMNGQNGWQCDSNNEQNDCWLNEMRNLSIDDFTIQMWLFIIVKSNYKIKCENLCWQLAPGYWLHISHMGHTFLTWVICFRLDSFSSMHFKECLIIHTQRRILLLVVIACVHVIRLFVIRWYIWSNGALMRMKFEFIKTWTNRIKKYSRHDKVINFRFFFE